MIGALLRMRRAAAGFTKGLETQMLRVYDWCQNYEE